MANICGGYKFSENDCGGISITGNVIYQDVINEPSDFPRLIDVKVGYTYTIGYKEGIPSLTRSGSTATANVSSIFYNAYINGNNIIVSDADQPEYNGTFVGTKGGPNQITYTVTGTPATPATGSPMIASPDTVIDNDVTKTNTGQTFNNNDEIIWNGTDWSLYGSDRIWEDSGTEVKTVNPRDIDFQNKHGISVADPVNAQDVSSKAYVDANQSNIYHFGLNGNDANDAKSLQERRLTGDAAIALANAHTPTPTGKNRVMIKATDGGSHAKFDLSGGPGFITLDAEETGFVVLITSGSPDGIKVGPAYQADIGYIINDAASDQVGALIEFLAGVSFQVGNIRKITNSGAIDHVLLESSGDNVFVNCDELRQLTNKNARAILVNDGTFRLDRNKYIRGLIQSLDGTTIVVKTLYHEGDIEIFDNVNFDIEILGEWTGRILKVGNNSIGRIRYGSRSTVLADINIHENSSLELSPADDMIGKITGLYTGCNVSIGSTTQKYSVAEGWGRITNSYTNSLRPTSKFQYILPVTDAVDPYTATAPFTALVVDETGAITELEGVLPTSSEDRDKILIGILLHQDFTQITNVENTNNTDISGYAVSDISHALGILQKVGNEFKITPYASDTRMEINAGTITSVGIKGRATEAARKNCNERTVAAKSPMSIIYIFRDGLGGILTWSTTTPYAASEAPQYYDDGTVVTPGNPPNGSVTSNQWTVHRPFKDATHNLEIYLFSQTASYGTADIAVTRKQIESFVFPDFIKFLAPVQPRILQNNAAFDNSNLAMAKTMASGRFDNSAVI